MRPHRPVRGCNRDDAGKTDFRIRKPVRQPQISRHFRRQFTSHSPDPRDHKLRAFVQTGAGIVKSVDRRARLKVQVARPVDSFQHVTKERFDVVDVQIRIVLMCRDQQIFGQ